jgi:hypothetical protein
VRISEIREMATGRDMWVVIQTAVEIVLARGLHRDQVEEGLLYLVHGEIVTVAAMMPDEIRIRRQ